MRVLLLVGQCHVEVEGAGSLYWLDLLHMGPSPSPHWLCLLHNGPLEPNPLPSNPCLTLLPCVPSPVNTHLAFKRLQVPAFHSLQNLNLWIPPAAALPPFPATLPLSWASLFLLFPLQLLLLLPSSTPPLHAPLLLLLLLLLLIITPLLLLLLSHLFASSVSPQDHPSVAAALPSSVQFPCNHGKGKLH